MPNVAGKKFPYTAAGKSAAKRPLRKLQQKGEDCKEKVQSWNGEVRLMARRGLYENIHRKRAGISAGSGEKDAKAWN